MAQLDYFSYSEQYFLVSTTFWLFYFNLLILFIVPFVQVMKMRKLIINYRFDDKRYENYPTFIFGDGKSATSDNPRFFS